MSNLCVSSVCGRDDAVVLDRAAAGNDAAGQVGLGIEVDQLHAERVHPALRDRVVGEGLPRQRIADGEREDARCAAPPVGTCVRNRFVLIALEPLVMRRSRTAWFFTMGPPTVPPNWFQPRSSFGRSEQVRAPRFGRQRLVAVVVPRRIREASLVPDLIDTLTTAPAERPNSAEKLLVWTLNSPMASGDGCTTCDDSDCMLVVPWLLSKPSSMKLFCVWKLPFTVNQPGPRISVFSMLLVAPGASSARSL